MYRVGTSGWMYADWSGVLYPPEVPKRDWLRTYAAEFPTVEINNSFYRLPSKDQFESWAAATGPDFVFSPKVSRYLSHVKRLREPAEPVRRWLQHARGLGDRLGPSLLQLPPNLHADRSRLVDTLDVWSPDERLAIEFRHDSWFTDDILRELADRDIALVLTDRRNHRPEPLEATASWGYVRLHEGTSRRSPDYGTAALHSWVERIATLWPKHKTDVFVYFNNDPTGAAVRNARTLRRFLRAGG